MFVVSLGASKFCSVLASTDSAIALLQACIRSLSSFTSSV
jgi:hypothetical protein